MGLATSAMQLPNYAKVQLASQESDVAILQIEEGSEEEEVIEDDIQEGTQRRVRRFLLVLSFVVLMLLAAFGFVLYIRALWASTLARAPEHDTIQQFGYAS